MRPREFDETEAIEAALHVFWQRGYEGTSIASLVAATGLKRQSLYNAFTDKPTLFRAALDRYVARTKESLLPLDRADAGLDDLRRYFDGVLELQRGEGLGACLLVKTAFGPEAADADVRATIERGARLVRTRFARVLATASERGEVASAVSPEVGAAFLYAVLNGVSALIRTGGDREHVRATLARTFESLEPPKSKKKKRRRR